ncbi:MAG: right-handed parallel beta-helix repeat-containing protein [Anaerolineales bacterium]|nr:right-handed parallel beta-helix repeat-containing protein [Anaerolineales bacterium]MCB9128171.1 right-handed parallel beta-helix repeat-containing protein [Ardenticatenales bacterium]MCB9171880.1 right-handed parallel beta-helix repeat-containing protein [Ardenticatenales bacterium]
MRRRLMQLLVLLFVAPILICVALGVLPAPSDEVVPPEAVVVGAPARDAAGGLVEQFPEMIVPAENASTPAKKELGHLLFFDPILSEANDISCASCHHPDLGLSDGRTTSMGAGGSGLGPDRSGGAEMTRNTPSLYEVGYVSDLFLDGRVQGLEAQAETPLTLATEMHANLDDTVAELTAIEGYQPLFAAAFPDDADPVNYDNVARAIAAFQRTLIAHDSPYDRFLAGDANALTPQQQRGLALFRSGATGCYKCHKGALLTHGDFAAIGVPNAEGTLDEDVGRFAVTGDEGDRYAFRTPTLRNIALTAPYMHNGVFGSLEEVLQFYADGGGRGRGLNVPTQSNFVRPFELNDQEMADMIAFFYALTDESNAPGIPATLPSGLVPVGPLDNPARAEAAAANVGRSVQAQREPTTLRVTPDQTIQSVVDQAINGDTIEIEYGSYHERVVVSQDGITIRGIANEAGDWPILDGQMNFADGIAGTGTDDFTVERLQLKNYKGNGVIIDGAYNVVMRDLYIENTSLYGAYPVHSTGVLVERVEATAIRDAGVYAGQCRDVILRDNVVYGNVIGIEIENSIGAELYNNHAYDNSTGLFVDLLPQLDSKVSQQTKLYDNIVDNNNHSNFAGEGEIGALVPEGTGILVLGGDDVEIYNNQITNNRSVGIAVYSTTVAFDESEVDVPPNPERVHTYGNRFENNGYDPADVLVEMGLPGADILWDGSRWDNRFDDTGVSTFPPVLPSSRWPDVVKRGYWQLLNFAINQLL